MQTETVFDFCTHIYGTNLEFVMDYARYRGGDVCAHVTGCVDQSRARMNDRQAIRALRRRPDSGAAGRSVTSPRRRAPPDSLDNSPALVVFNHPTNRPHDSYYFTTFGRLYYLLPNPVESGMKAGVIFNLYHRMITS